MSQIAATPSPPPYAPLVLASAGTTTVVLVVILALLGMAMVGVSIWLVRSTRSDPSALGPLEVMGERGWRQRDAEARAAALGGARPAGAPPPAPVVEYEPLDDEPADDGVATSDDLVLDDGEDRGSVESATDQELAGEIMTDETEVVEHPGVADVEDEAAAAEREVAEVEYIAAVAADEDDPVLAPLDVAADRRPDVAADVEDELAAAEREVAEVEYAAAVVADEDDPVLAPAIADVADEPRRAAATDPFTTTPKAGLLGRLRRSRSGS